MAESVIHKKMMLARVRRSFLRYRKGSALIIVLAFLVLLSGIVLAFFSRALDHRQISTSSSANARAEIFAEAATEIILGDLLQEIEEGSEDDPLLPPANAEFIHAMRPRWETDSRNSSLSLAPSMVPQRVATDGIASILKKSKEGTPFFNKEKGVDSIGPDRAAAVSTTSASLNRRSIPLENWQRPFLMTVAESNQFTAPDWIYVDREGNHPTDFSTDALKILSDAKSDNLQYVIGRFAYVVYDVGGLIDANVVGNKLATTENARRGRLHQVALSDTSSVPVADFAQFLNWRAGGTGADSDSVEGSGALFDPQRTFIKTASGDDGFVNRQDLIRYAQRSGSPISTDSLPWLTVLSRDLNAPSFASDPQRPKLPAANPPSAPDPNLMNPDLLGESVRFPQETTLSRGGDHPVTVPAGTSVMPRRFPLSKLDLLLSNDPASVAPLAYYFGLRKKSDHVFEYVAGKGDVTNGFRIMRLDEVVAEGREPNFFEILQAVLYTGSLGKTGGNTYMDNDAKDALQNLQILQIGANIMDQWDADDIPTTIEYPAPNIMVGSPPQPEAQAPYSVYGIENLPYINQVAITGYSPPYNRDLFQVWALFDVWNPHQNAGTTPSGISQFRIRPISGTNYIDMFYQYLNPTNNEIKSATWRKSPTQSVVTTHGTRALSFPANGDYSEPTTVGVEPTTASLVGGVLLIEDTVPMAVPPEGLRSEDLDDAIEDTGKSFGVKAYNTFRLWNNASTPYTFVLEADLGGGNWYPYQVVENLFATAASDRLFNKMNGDKLGEEGIDTHYTKASGATMQLNGFYTWRSPGSVNSLMRVDPRTSRFGLIGVGGQGDGGDVVGVSLRTDPGTWNGTAQDAASIRKWVSKFGNYGPGRGSPASNFERVGAKDGVFSLVANHPEKLDAEYPYRYPDPDGVTRPADGYFGALPTIPGRFDERPVILNRRFRSVGELGYAFRDTPWKTLDFSSRYSADLGLLDVFSLDESVAADPIIAGKINLNGGHPEVFESLLSGSAKSLPGIHTSVPGSYLTEAEAKTIAQALVDESKIAPFVSKGDMVSRVMHPLTGSSPLTSKVKAEREAAVRTLAEMGTTRTWNVMIDLIAQTGRFVASSSKGEDFMVQGERRVWVHVAIDRLTGRVLSMQREVVYE